MVSGFVDAYVENAGGGGGGGTTDHAALSHLDYASAGHTGFEPAKGADDNYVTDAQLVVIGNTSGTNTGDQTLAGLGGVSTTRTISTTAPLTGGGDLSADRTLAIPAATNAADGYLTAADHTTFAAKQDTLTTGNLTATAPILLDQTRQVIGGSAVVSLDSAYMPRERLSANRTYYVRTDGNDSNTGLVNNAAGAFLTIQKAFNTINSLDTGVYNLTIQLGDGTYTAGATQSGSLCGSGSITLVGNVGTPSNVIISTTSSTCFTAFGCKNPMYISSMKLQTTTSGNCIVVQSGVRLTVTAVEFGACAGIHIVSGSYSTILMSGDYTISGGAVSHYYAYTGYISGNTYTVTISGTPAFSIFTFASATGIGILYSITFSGSATGKRYQIELNSVMNTNGGGANFFPGNVAGTAATGGQYV